jgi:hypothetical protein
MVYKMKIPERKKHESPRVGKKAVVLKGNPGCGGPRQARVFW